MLVEQTQQAQLVFAVDDGGRRGAGAVVAGRSEDFVEPIELGSPATRQLKERLELALLLVAAHPRDLDLPGRAFRATTGAGRFVRFVAFAFGRVAGIMDGDPFPLLRTSSRAMRRSVSCP